jgi:hypothetical protein
MSTAPPEPVDPFDVDSIRVSSLEDVGLKEVLTTVPVRKPGRQDFVRVHPDPAYTIDTLILEHEDGLDRNLYLVPPICGWI